MPIGTGDTIEKIDAGTQTTCYFMKPGYMKSKGMFQEGEKEMGIITAVLRHLLDARKRTRGLIKQTDDEFDSDKIIRSSSCSEFCSS